MNRFHRVCGLAILAAGLLSARQSAPSDKTTPTPLTPSTGTPTFGTTVVIPSGLRGDVYFLKKGTSVLPDFERLRRKPEGTVWTTTLNIPPHHWRSGFPGVTKRFEWFAVNYIGRFWIEKPGAYRFALLSDDGSRLYIDEQLVIDNDCQHSPDVRGAVVTLSGGVHRIRLPYFQGPRDCLALILAVAPPDDHWRIFNTDEFKPPANPEDWKFAPAGDLGVHEEPDPDTPNAIDLRGEPPAELTSGAVLEANGCAVYPPVHFCGK